MSMLRRSIDLRRCIARTVMILQYAGPEGYNSQLAILSNANLNVKSH